MGLYDRDYMRADAREDGRDYQPAGGSPRRNAPWVAAAAVVMILLMLLFSC